MAPLDQCLHLQILSKNSSEIPSLDKEIKKLEEAVKKSDWEGAIRVFWGSRGLKKDDGVE